MVVNQSIVTVFSHLTDEREKKFARGPNPPPAFLRFSRVPPTPPSPALQIVEFAASRLYALCARCGA